MFFLLVVVLFLSTATAIAQTRFQPTIESARQAILRGQTKEALAAYEAEARAAEERARANAYPQKDWQLASAAYREAAVMSLLSGDIQTAISYAEKAAEAADKTKIPVVQLNALVRLRDIYRTIGNFDRAKELIDKQFEITKLLKGYGKLNWESSIYAQRATDFIDRDIDHNKAIDDLHQALALNQAVLENFDHWQVRYQNTPIEFYQGKRISFLDLLAVAYGRVGHMDAAIEQYRSAIHRITEWNLQYFDEYRLHVGLGQVLHRKGALEEALQHITNGLSIAERQGRSDAIIRASLSMAELAAKLGDHETAIRRYQEAIRRIEASRSTLSTEEFRQSYFAGGIDAYVGVVDALVRAGKPGEAFNYSERARSRAFLDVLASKPQFAEGGAVSANDPSGLREQMRALEVAAKVAHNNSETKLVTQRLLEAEKAYTNFVTEVRKTNPEQASLMSVEPLTFEEVQKLLEQGQVLFQYFVTLDRTYLWVLGKHELKLVIVPVSKEHLSSKIDNFRKAVAEVGAVRDVQSRAQDLYRFLVEPALPCSQGKELIIVPHDVLHYLPFQALYSPKGRYFIEDHAVSYLSSASLLQFTNQKRRPLGDRVLAVGNPDLRDPSKDLEFAHQEVEKIRAIYPNSTVLLREQATKSRLKALSSEVDIIHLAAHAELKEDDPLSSAILLTKEDKDEGRLDVREVFGMELKANLVVLSGCDTGLGKISKGDELTGLTRAFIYAGTPSVVASLWKVEDSSTAVLMESVYRNLKTKTKVEALREAQLSLLRGEARGELIAHRGVGGIGKLGDTPGRAGLAQKSFSTSHPYFWAPFVLVGDGK